MVRISLRSNLTGRVEALECAEEGQQIVEVGLVQPRRIEHRHG